MKKLVLTTACALVAGASFAQGTVNWSSISPNGLTFTTNTTTLSYLSTGAQLPAAQATGVASSTAGSYYYELLYQNSGSTGAATAAPTTLAALDSWVDTGIEALNGTTGKVLPTVANETSLSVPGTTSGGSYSFIVVGWSANLGTTWSAVSSVLNSPSQLAAVVGVPLFGESTTAFAPLGTGNPGATLIGTAAGEIKSLNTPLEPIASAPEPTTIALGVMGAASLMALRRKKA